MSNVFIPKGRKLKLNLNGRRYVNVDMILMEDLTITLSSKFQPLVSGDAQPIVSALGGLFRDLTGTGFSGQYKELGFQQWTGTDPLSLSPTVGFYMKKNAKTDVFDPALKLMELPLPDDRGGIGGLVPPGPSLLTVLSPQNKRGKVISIQVGNILRLNNVLIEKAEPTFSVETDENGYPINAKIRLDIKTVYTATVQLINPSNVSSVQFNY